MTFNNLVLDFEAEMADDFHFQRLTEALDWNYLQQRADREIHQKLIRYLMGENYPTRTGESGPETSINLISMAYRAMSRHTISKSPRVLANTADPQLKAWAENGEISTNKRIQRSDLTRQLREVTNQSMVSFGTLFLAPAYVGTTSGMRLDLAIQSIDRADFVYDIESPSLEEADFQGHKFRIPVIDVREHPLFDENMRQKVDASPLSNNPDDEQTNFRKAFGRKSELYDYCELWCVYERRRNKIIYFPRHQPDILLLETDWLGPRHGPYRYLYYEKPPNHAVPISPLMHLLKKHRSFNLLDVKATHQQQRAKNALFYTNASKEEADALIESLDDQGILHENGAIRHAHIGGADQATVAMAEKQKRDFSYAAGNLDQYLGLAAQAPTLGQERLLSGAANEMLEDMAGYAYQFVKGVGEDIFWFDMRDPSDEPQQLRKPIPGTDMTYATTWTKAHREMALDMEFDVDVEPYSYIERSPSSRLADLLGAVQLFMGMADQMVAQGISLDVEAIVRTVAKYKNLPELYDCLVLNQDPAQLQQLLGQRSGTNPVDASKPNGRYTRTSESDGTGEAMEMMRAMGGSKETEISAA